MFIENRSKFNFSETVEQITNAAQTALWKIPHIHDLKETLKKSELDVLPVKVLEMCKPSLSYRILSKDSEKIFASMMPCRISVYQKEDGVTYISRMNAKALAGTLQGESAEVMTKAFNEMEAVIAPFLYTQP